MTDTLTKTVSEELKKFYFKNFRRRGKSLKTLELIKECYNDQYNFFINELSDIIEKSLIYNDEKRITELLYNFKKNEGCNKKIMKTVVYELLNKNKLSGLDLNQHKYLFEFEDEKY